MMKLGIIGMNEGNGHPFSYSAIFNGYDPEELKRRCPFKLIQEYLPREHNNKVFIESAKVTHIWTQDKQLSEDVARVSLIPNIVDQMEEMIGEVDAVILARDDPWNHLKMAMPFLKKKIPIFIDKQLVANSQDLDELLKYTSDDYPIMAGSSMRFTRDVLIAKEKCSNLMIKSIHGMSRVSWLRYGHHLLEGIVPIFGYDIDWVRSLRTKPDHDIVQIQFSTGLNVILEFIEDIHLPIQFTCYSEKHAPYPVLFQDFFYSFREMMIRFVQLAKSGEKAFPFDEMIGIAKIVLAGEISKKTGGKKINPVTLACIE